MDKSPFKDSTMKEAREFVEKIEDGTIKRRVPPAPDEPPFDEDRAFENFKALLGCPHMAEAMRRSFANNP